MNTRIVNHCCCRWIRSITSKGIGDWAPFHPRSAGDASFLGVDLLVVCEAQLERHSHPVQSQFENLSDFRGLFRGSLKESHLRVVASYPRKDGKLL